MIFNCITCEREGNYLPATMDSFTQMFPGEKLHVHNDAKKLGTVFNWLVAAEYSLNYNDDYHMIIEDDILFLSDKIHNFPQTEYIVSPYCSERNRLDHHVNVWHWPNFAKWWCGALCLILPSAVLKDIVLNKGKLLDLSMSETLKEPVHLDTAIGCFVNHKLLTHTYSLIDHIGLVSVNPINNKLITPSHRVPALK